MPSISVTVDETAPPKSGLGDTGTGFTIGTSVRGIPGARLIRSMSELTRYYGPDSSDTTLYKAVNQFFLTGGTKVYVSRKVSSTAVAASAALGTVLTYKANSAGAWGNSVKAGILAGSSPSSFVVEVEYPAGTVVERSPEFADTASLIEWVNLNSEYGTATPLAGDLAAVAKVALTGGDDAAAGLTNADRDTALGYLGKALGPGQLWESGAQTQAAYLSLATAAIATERVALLELPDTSDKATLKAGVSYLRTLSLTAQRHVAFFGGAYPILPGSSSGSKVLGSPTAAAAGVMAKSDRANSPNIAAAGANGVLTTAFDVSREFTDPDHEELNAYGVNLFRIVRGEVRLMGYRTAADKDKYPLWWPLANARLLMYIINGLSAIGDDFIFSQLDGQKQTISKFEGRQTGFLQTVFLTGALYGDTPQEAFYVDVGAQVNTEETQQNGELRSVITLRMSPTGEDVKITIVKKQITEEV